VTPCAHTTRAPAACSASPTVRVWLPWLAVLLLAGCGSLTRLQPDATPPMHGHEAAVRAQTNWSLRGRIAFKHAADGGSGRIDWHQRDAALSIDLSAPMTRQRLTIRAILGQSICIDGLDDGSVCDREAERLLVDLFGDSIPLHMFQHWVRGLPASNAPSPGVIHYDHVGRPKTLGQAGWMIVYQAWHPADDAHPQLPRRIEISKDATRLRLVIDEWGWGDDARH